MMLPWTEPGWRAQAEAWIHARLADQGMRAAGAIDDVKMRIWSCVMRVPTTEGTVYFKAPAPSTRFEVPLTAALACWHPQMAPVLLGVDLARGWLLMRDAGPRIRDVLATGGDYRVWYRALADYADMQIALAPRAAELLAMGVPDRRLSRLPALYEAMLEADDLLMIDQPGGLGSGDLARLRALAPRIAAQCEALAAFGLPETLDHNDIHDGNMLLGAGGVPLVFDWGDAGVAHPFMSLTVALRMVAYSLKQPVDRPFEVPEAVRARDAYLEPWTRFAPRARLLEASDLAFRLGMICRGMVWLQILAPISREQRGNLYDGLVSWLQEWLGANAPEA
jgi:hypothetical protein